jgi:ribosomal protein S12 methylthiotransferase
MWRHYSTQNIINILNQIKKIFPIRFIRTNFIIWFPGETEKHFNQLISFIKKFNFDNIALFEYHDEPMAASFKLPDKVNPKIIRQRFVKLQKLVNQILNQKQKSRIWKIYQWTIVEILKWKKFSIRPQISSPEIDPCDKINFNQLISFITQQKKSEINIWDKINYKLKN